MSTVTVGTIGHESLYDRLNESMRLANAATLAFKAALPRKGKKPFVGRTSHTVEGYRKNLNNEIEAHFSRRIGGTCRAWRDVNTARYYKFTRYDVRCVLGGAT